MDQITIVLAEDHALMREATRHILEQYPEFKVVGEAEDGLQALEMIESLKPDVAILDIRMPKVNGIEVVRRMKLCCPSTKALMLTAYDDDDYIIALMEAGASGYLLKTTRAKELADAVRTVYSGESALHPTIAWKMARLLAPKGTSSMPRLSTCELQVLELAAKGLRNKEIAVRLGINYRTIDGYFHGIFAKLGVSSRVEAVLAGWSRHLITRDKDKEHQ
jgi:DNA-binding NarL/FixJ family response regulator